MTNSTGRVSVLCGLLVAATTAVGGAVPAIPVAAPAAVATTHADETLPVRFATAGEPDLGLSVGLAADRRVGRPGNGSATLDLAVVPELGATSVTVELEATGRARLRSEALLTIDVPAGGIATSVPVDYVVAGGEGSVVVRVRANGPDGTALAAERADLSLLEEADEALAGTAGITSLRLEAFDRHEAPTLPAGEAADQRAAILDGATLVSTAEVAALGHLNPGPDEVGVEGTVEWTDENGVQHPYRFAEIQLWENDFGGDDLIATVFTDQFGGFGTVVNNDDGTFQGGRDIYLRARTVGESFRVVTTGDDPYSLRSPTVDDMDGGTTYAYTLVGANDDDQGRAFSVHQSMALAVPYAHRVNGAPFRDLDVIYPNGGTGSFFDGTDLQIEGLDQWDWDTIHHEYGHFVGQEIDIEDNPGGSHNLGDNLSEAPGRDKDEGTRLAWGEAWPTYFAITLQQAENAAALNVPRVGDLRYQAFETANTGIDYSMETTDGGGVPGEDNEVAVQRALWDLYDDADDDGDNEVDLGDVTIWNRLDAADPTTFSTAWNALTAPMTDAEQANAGCIASNWGMAPDPTAPLDGAVVRSGVATPTFRWDEGGGGPAFLNDEFVVRFWNDDYTSLLHTSPPLMVAEYTPDAAAWSAISVRRNVRWTVTGTQSDAPATGPYLGCGRQLVIEQGPGAILELAGCRDNVLARNDDGSTSAVPMGISPNFFGTTYSDVFVNNNGNVTFDRSLSTFTPFPLLSTARVIMAPFFADVDTRNGLGGAVTYGETRFGARDAFCVNWIDVGYYSRNVDRTNSFQLVLVDRSNVAPGDFDIIFNFDKVQWETGDASGGSGGVGGSSARVGYASAGFDAFELQGSGINGAFLDTNVDGLIHGNLNSTQQGRYVFRVRNGAATGVAVAGVVTDEGGSPVPGAPVDVCAAGAGCVSTSTNSLGEYRIEPVPDGTYNMRVGAPAGTAYNIATVGPFDVTGTDVVIDVVLTGPTPPPAGTVITPARGGGSVPIVYYNDPLDLTTTGCAGGAATYTVTGTSGVLASGTMTEGPAGTYTAVIPPFFPNHGPAVVAIDIDCPDPDPDESFAFDIYIDPSGTVLDLQGNPVEGATVTLYRSDFAEGPFEIVPDGSAIMSPANRQNPMVTGADGRFGWDTIAGFYVVRAEADGCVDPTNEEIPYVETPSLPVPPPQLDLELVLDCGEPPTPEGLIQSMLDSLSGLDGAPPGIVVSLTRKLENALASIERGNVNAACGQLGAFVNEAEALDGKWLGDLEAADFVATAEEVKVLLGCRR